MNHPTPIDEPIAVAAEALHLLRDELNDTLIKFQSKLIDSIQSAYLLGYAKGLTEADPVPPSQD